MGLVYPLLVILLGITWPLLVWLPTGARPIGRMMIGKVAARGATMVEIRSRASRPLSPDDDDESAEQDEDE